MGAWKRLFFNEVNHMNQMLRYNITQGFWYFLSFLWQTVQVSFGIACLAVGLGFIAFGLAIAVNAANFLFALLTLSLLF